MNHRNNGAHGIRNGKYKSLFESRIAIQLRNTSFSYEPKDKIFSYNEQRKYTPDFYLNEYNIFIETKGFFKASDRTKMLLIKEQYPDVTIVFVFQNARTKLNKNSKTTYGDWATKHGFVYFDSCIPLNFNWETLCKKNQEL